MRSLVNSVSSAAVALLLAAPALAQVNVTGEPPIGDIPGTIPLSKIAPIAPNTVVGNFGGSTAAPTANILGTGVATALGVNVGSAGAPVLFNGALGTPSSGTATNLTGTAASLTAGHVTTNANLTGPVTSTGNATAVTASAITNAMLATPATTVNGQTCTLGLTCTVTAAATSITPGTTTIPSGGTVNGLLYDSAGILGNLATGNNGVLVTDGTGVPSISSTLPSALTIPSPTISGTLIGPDDGTWSSSGLSGLAGINNTPIGATTPSTGAFTTLTVDTSIAAALAFPGSFGATPTNFMHVNIGAFPTSGEVPAGVMNGISSEMSVPSGYTQAPWPNANFFAGMLNANGGIAGNSAVNYLAMGMVTGANSLIDNFNSVCTNTTTTPWQPTTNTGVNFGECNALEADVNVLKVSGAAPSGQVNGVELVGASEVVPTGDAYGVHLLPLGSGVPWTVGFQTEAGAAVLAANIGPLAAGASQASQPIYLNATSSGSANLVASLQEDDTGQFVAAATVLETTTFNATGAVILQQSGTDIIQSGGSYFIFSDFGANGAIFLGNSSNDLWRATSVVFSNVAGSANYLTINSTSITTPSGVDFVDGNVKSCNGSTAAIGTDSNGKLYCETL